MKGKHSLTSFIRQQLYRWLNKISIDMINVSSGDKSMFRYYATERKKKRTYSLYSEDYLKHISI